jgi:hypothetical protein
MLWAVVRRNSQVPLEAENPAPQTAEEGHSASQVLVNVGPFILVAGVWVFMVFRLAPKRLRRQYLRDPSMQGEFTVRVSPASISIENTAGSSTTAGWNIYEDWREGKAVIILSLFSGAYFILGLTELPEPQRAELCGILAAALPKK